MSSLLAHYCAFFGDISADQFLPQAKFIRDVGFGMAAAASPIMFRFVEQLHEMDDEDPSAEKRWAHTEKRLSYNLNADRYDDEAVARGVHERAARFTTLNDGLGVVIAIDYTDVNKHFASPEGMEHTVICWDGSKGDKDRGYPVVQLQATVPGHDGRRVGVPLHYHLFSYTEPGFMSQPATFNEEIAKATPFVGPLAWWVLDRGFDSVRNFTAYDVMGMRWIVRLNTTTTHPRQLRLADGTEGTADVLAESIRGRFSHTYRNAAAKKADPLDDTATLAEKQRGRKKLSLGVARVIAGWDNTDGGGHWVPCDRSLVVVRGFGETPLTLLVHRHIEADQEALVEVLMAYMYRWGAETATRAAKDSRGWGVRVEDLRALKIRGARRLMWLSAAVYVALADFELTDPEGALAVARRVTAPGDLPLDLRPRLFRALGSELRGMAPEDREWWRRTGRRMRTTGARVSAAVLASAQLSSRKIASQLRRARTSDPVRLLAVLQEQRSMVDAALAHLAESCRC